MVVLISNWARAAMQLQNFDVDAFLRDHWQKKPLLIKNPFVAWANPIEPDDLAGLACEEEVESRLIMQAGDDWQMEQGPFDEARFGELGTKEWTLLVQAVDHYIPEVAALIDPFRFIPNWRIDDVMVSYAVDGGGVGPHFDQYDVFLIQGLGKRRWQVGAVCDENTALIPHDDLRLLANFEVAQEWVLEPGDILYVPPGVAHNGVAVTGDCMTYSIGFRAPSASELISNYCDHLLDHLLQDARFTDPDLQVQENPGEISAAAMDRLHAMVAQQLLDRDGFARWFGQYNSTPKYPEMDWRPEEELTQEQLRKRLVGGAILSRNPASRFSFGLASNEGIMLFADGQCFDCSPETSSLARHICEHGNSDIGPEYIRCDAALGLILQLCNQGSLTLDF
jgi:50S ribosomal protein L16 3-hydroxylase